MIFSGRGLRRLKAAVPAQSAVVNGDPPVGAPTPDGARRDAVMRGDGTDAHIRCHILRLMVGLEALRGTSLAPPKNRPDPRDARHSLLRASRPVPRRTAHRFDPVRRSFIEERTCSASLRLIRPRASRARAGSARPARASRRARGEGARGLPPSSPLPRPRRFPLGAPTSSSPGSARSRASEQGPPCGALRPSPTPVRPRSGSPFEALRGRLRRF